MQTSGFFDAMEVGNGQYDREYVAAQFAKYFSLFVGNGVFVQTANALQIVSAGDMNIIMHAGAAFVNGYWYINDSDLMYTIPINTESTARYDSVVIAFDTVERTAEMRYKVNDISVDRQDELNELQIAQVVVNAGTVEITDAYIIDKRPDESVCGFVKGLVEVLTTNELFNQFNAQFVEWFDTIKGQLSEDAAGSLQLQVDERVLKSNVVKTAEEIENGTDEEKVAGILAIKGLLQKINNSINGRVLKSKVLSRLALVINATSEEEVAGALAVKELNSDVIELNQNMGDITAIFNNQTVIAPTVTNGTLICGGYTKIGNLIIVALRIKVTGTGRVSVTLPKPIYSGNCVAGASYSTNDNTLQYFWMDTNGLVTINGQNINYEYLLSFSYIAK